MTTFSYTTGNPANLTAGASASMNDIQGPLNDLKTFLNGGNLAEDNMLTALLQRLGLNNGAQVGRGKSIVATTESRTNVAFGLMPTPDRVSGVVLPANGLIAVAYQATWQESTNGGAVAAIFLGASQVGLGDPNNVSGAGQGGAAFLGGGTPAIDHLLASSPLGLSSVQGTAGNNTAYGGDLTTGQVVGGGYVGNAAGTPSTFLGGGPCYIFAAAGTYDVSVQFKASAGSVTAKNRKLWVWTLGF